MLSRSQLLAAVAALLTGCAADGAPGALLGFADEPAGGNCPVGGTRIDAGRDDDGDGRLDPDEVDTTTYVCDGGDGTDGSDGTDGTDVLIDVTPEPPGAHCPAGGHRVDTGVDDDGDGVLDPAEVSSTAYVCDGDDGDPAIAGFQLIGRVALPTGPVAEIVAASPDGLTLAYTSGDAGDVGFVDVTEPRRPAALGVVDVAGTVASGRGEPTSVAITPDGRFAVVAVKDAADPIGRADPGALVFIAMATRTIAGAVALGVGPDSVHLTPDGTRAVVAIEDEEDPDGNAVAQARPGAVQLVTIDAANPSASTVVTIALAPTVGNHPTDPQPEYVDVTPDGTTAIVTLQENNVLAVIELATATVVRYVDAGTSRHGRADLANDRAIDFTATGFVGQLQPDAACLFADGSHVLTANEGDVANGAFAAGLYSGGRGFSVFTLTGDRVYDSGDALEWAAVKAGVYPDRRSANRGIEPEGCAVGRFGGTEYGFLVAERSSALFVLDLSTPTAPAIRQVLGAPMRPESAVAIAARGLVVVGGEGDGTGGGLWIYQAVTDPAEAGHGPGVYDLASDGLGFGAVSALAHDPATGLLLAMPDNAYGAMRVWSSWFDHGARRLQVIGERLLRDAAGQPLTGYDPEGLAVLPDGGLVVASEGVAGNGAAASCLGSAQSNRLLFFDPAGRLDLRYGGDGIVDLPCGAAPGAIDWAAVTGDGFEGVAAIGVGAELRLYVALQRGLSTDGRRTRIGEYTPATDTWRWFFYTLDPDRGGAAGVQALSELIQVGGDRLAVIERDGGWAGEAATKAVMVFRLGSGTADVPTDPVDKVRAVDLLAGRFRFDQERLEGLALADGALWVVNDNGNDAAATFAVRHDRAALEVEPAAVAGQSAVRVNEVNSSGADFVELINLGATAVDLSGWKLTDNDPTHVLVLPAGTTLAAGARLLIEGDTSTAALRLTFGLGSADAIVLSTPTEVRVDHHTWTTHVASASRCSEGRGAFVATTPTPGAANACP